MIKENPLDRSEWSPHEGYFNLYLFINGYSCEGPFGSLRGAEIMAAKNRKEYQYTFKGRLFEFPLDAPIGRFC